MGGKINKSALYCSNMALLLPRRFQGFLNAGMGAAVSLWGVRGGAAADRSGEAIIHIVLLKQVSVSDQLQDKIEYNRTKMMKASVYDDCKCFLFYYLRKTANIYAARL